MQWRSRVLVTGLCAALVLTGAQAAQAAPPPGAVPAGAAPVLHSVTLVTGDVVHLERLPGGRRTATVEPGPGRERISFLQHEVDGTLSVIPGDAVPQLASGRLDPALFDVDGLVEQGYTDELADTLPLILTYGDDLRTAAAPAAATLGATLTSIEGRAVRADKERATTFWRSVQSGAIERIALDRKVRASLDTSVPQIGAPEAWAAGYDGTGTTVAVLDTGYDAAHPDLRGVVVGSANFTPSPDTSDHFGHGTHVAATVAGTGAASGGARKGVAPGADLLIGKVLDDNGFGLESWVLDGMEWAAASGADVVNLSLGGPGDGTDPLSQAVNALTEQTGTLFVVSAGNDGELGMSTVGSPGNADAALTVGAVDRDDVLAAFSSRGPRLGDMAVKPDITAPGVGIVAARASGTAMGRPVDDDYTAASGTSMAAPHVAGAAAILAQRHPGWSGPQLKDALASTSAAEPGQSVFEHGGGRVDMARAVAQGVYATGTLDLGEVTEGAAPVRREVRYTNTTAESVTLSLSLDVRSLTGAGAGRGVRLEQSSVDIEPGASATVGVVADPAHLARGVYGGRLTATAGDVVVHTSVGTSEATPTHEVTIRAVGRDGGPVFTPYVAIYGEDRRFDAIAYIPVDASTTLEVPEGTNHLVALVETGVEEIAYQFVDPEFEVTGDRTYVLDVARTTLVRVETPKPATQQGIFSFYVHREFGARDISNTAMKFDGTRELWVTPTARPVPGVLEFGARWSLLAPQLTARALSAGNVTVLPRYVSGSPMLDGRRVLGMLPAGSGTPEEFARADFRNRVALIDPPKPGGWHDYDVLAAAAADAGAALVLATEPVPGLRVRGRAAGEVPGDLPAMIATVTAEEGARLTAALGRGRVTLALSGVPESPYLYDVMQYEQGQVPRQVVHRVTARNSATVRTTYHESGGAHRQKEQRFGWRPWQDTAINQYQRLVATPRVREEVVTAGDTLWQHRVRHFESFDDFNPLSGGMTQAPRTYRPGERAEDAWYAPVVRPAIPRGVPGLESSRTGDSLRIRIPEFVDSGTAHYGFAEEGGWDAPADEVSARLYRDGALVAEAPRAWGDFPASAAPATYRLELSTARDSEEWRFATRTETAWTFSSRRSAEAALLPLLQVDYGLATDRSNQVLAGRRATIGLTPRHQDGLAAPPVRSVEAWVSYDDGKTWTPARVFRAGARFEASVAHPPLKRTNGFVALRVRAEDRTGNSVEQTVLRAYGLKVGR